MLNEIITNPEEMIHPTIKLTPPVEQPKLIKIIRGIYGSYLIENETFECITTEMKQGPTGTSIKVMNRTNDKYPKKILKIMVSEGDFEFVANTPEPTAEVAQTTKHASDKKVLEGIREKFGLMEQLALSCAMGQIKGLVISGAPGTGKSYNVQKVLEQNGFENIVIGQSELEDVDLDMNQDEEMLDGKNTYIMCKGRVTPLALYKILYDHSNAVIVFDDCDSILYDPISLNILKAALDSYSKRMISWNSRAVGFNLPRKFEFTGRIIFISNLYFDQIKEGSKLRLHVDAIMSRCHFLDLGMDSNNEKILRIRQSIEDGLFRDIDITEKQTKELISFIVKHQNEFREISLRTALKIAETMLISPDNWKKLAYLTCLGGRSKSVTE